MSLMILKFGGGDGYPSLLDFTRIYPYYDDDCGKRAKNWPDYAISHVVPIETKYNLALRQGRSFAANCTKPQATACEGGPDQFIYGITSKQPERWDYNRALLQEPDAGSYFEKPRDFKVVSKLTDQFSWTPRKSAGQLVDMWRIRLAGDYGKVDAEQGDIVAFQKSNFQGLYCWQERGLCILPIEAVEYRSTDAGTINIQSGAVFNKAFYVTRQYGTQHRSSTWFFDGQMGAWDAIMGVFVRHSQAGFDQISKSENINDLVQAFTLPISAADMVAVRGYRATVGTDYENGEVLMTIRNRNGEPFTFVYSVPNSLFTGFYDVFPVRYGNRGRTMYSVRPDRPNMLYTHNRGRYGEWYDTFYSTILRFVINPYPSVNKVFDNAKINVPDKVWEWIDKIEYWTPNGGAEQYHALYPVKDDRFRFWQNTLNYPLHEWDWDAVKERLEDHYAYARLTIKNDESNRQVPISSISTEYRVRQ